jgi:hypothetical protein
MRPVVKRRLVTLAAVVSLLLSIATVVLWMRSYFIADGWWDSREDRLVVAGTQQGAIFLDHATLNSGPAATPMGIHRFKWKVSPGSGTPAPDPGVVREWTFLGFHWFISEGGSGPAPGGFFTTPPRWQVRVPLWFIATLFALFPLRWMIRARCAAGPGRCTSCGYDLRATPDRCPECGAVPASAVRCVPP